MDSILLITMLTVGVVAPLLASLFQTVIPLLVRLTLRSTTFQGRQQTIHIDRLLYEHTRNRAMDDFERYPTDGFHLYGGLLLRRTTVAATAYSSGRVEYQCWGGDPSILQPKMPPNTIQTLHTERLDPHHWITQADFSPAVSCRGWQVDVCHRIVYQFRRTANVAVVICGPSKTGKSTLATCLTYGLQYGRVKPWLIQGFSFATPGDSLLALLDPYIPDDRPIILLVNEFERCLPKEDDGKFPQATRSLSSSVELLNNELDRIRRKRNLIVIATTEVKSSDLKKTFGSTVGSHRFDWVEDVA